MLLSVSDDGPGIPLADRERVFDRFVRVGEDRARDDGGSGLAIVAQIAHTRGSDARAVDSPLGGALVAIRLPADTDP